MKPAPHAVFTLLIAAVLAAIALPSEPDDEYVPQDALPLQIQRAERNFWLHSELLRRAHSKMVARAAVANVAPGRGDVAYYRAPGAPVELETRVRGYAQSTLEKLPRRDAEMRLVLALVVDTGRMLAGVEANRPGSTLSIDFFPPGVISDGACVAVVRAHTPSMWYTLERRLVERLRASAPNVVGPCAWYATYGKPGPGIAAWLDSTGFLAIRDRVSMGGVRLDRAGRTRPQSWVDVYGGGPIVTTLHACRRGDLSACNESVMSATRLEFRMTDGTEVRTDNWIGSGRGPGYTVGGASALLFRVFAKNSGADRMAQLWHHPGPLPAAFEAASGQPLERWVQRQLTFPLDDEPTGPLPAAFDLTTLLVALAAFIALGVRAVARRGAYA